MKLFVVSLHESYKTGVPTSHGGFHSKYSTREEAEESVNEMVNEDLDIFENRIGRPAIPGEDFTDSNVTRDDADCYRHTDIDNSECFYYIDEIEI